MPVALSRSYVARDGRPIIDRVDPRIFSIRYFARCMECTFCDDSCCQYGADVEIALIKRLESWTESLEAYLGEKCERWFLTDPEECGIHDDPDYPGGAYTRSRVVPLPTARSRHNQEACIFLDPSGRGCRLHRFALENALDVHQVKPLVCILFPVGIWEGELCLALEIEEEILICQGEGPTIYRSVRPELEYYFGIEFVHELDHIESGLLSRGQSDSPGSIPLQIVSP